MANNLPKKGIIADTTNYGEVKLPAKAERVYGKPAKSDCTAMYLDRDGRVQAVHYRMPAAKKPKGQTGAGSDTAPDDVGEVSKPRPDVTRKGAEMMGDYRTDALREALGRAPIEDDTLMALLILAFEGQNVSVMTGSGVTYGQSRLAKHAAALFDADGKLCFDMDSLRVAARAVLVDVFSCRENATIAASSPASQARWSAPTISCRTWARRTSCPVCRALPSSRRARRRRSCRASA